MKAKKSSAKKVGKVLAHIQSAVDDVVAFGFRKMKEAGGKEKPFEKPPKTLPEKGKVALKKTVKFLGQAGESFYQEYEQLKAKKAGENLKK